MFNFINFMNLGGIVGGLFSFGSVMGCMSGVFGVVSLVFYVNVMEQVGVMCIFVEFSFMVIFGEVVKFYVGGLFDVMKDQMVLLVLQLIVLNGVIINIFGIVSRIVEIMQYGILLNFLLVVMFVGCISFKLEMEVFELIYEGLLSSLGIFDNKIGISNLGVIYVGICWCQVFMIVELFLGGLIMIVGFVSDDVCQVFSGNLVFVKILILGMMFCLKDFQ